MLITVVKEQIKITTKERLHADKEEGNFKNLMLGWD